MRGKDNWINAHDYILNQLFKYNYNDPKELHILKLKYWVLDDDVLVEENLIDNDYDNSLNHRKILDNELKFLDRYIRTKDKKLSQDEESFSTLVRERKIAQRDFISEINETTKKRKEKWEQNYISRPTTLSNAQFQELYVAYKIKEQNGELSSAYDITDKLDTITIDNRKFQCENSIFLYKEPTEQEQLIRENALREKQKEDIHLVYEMRRVHSELIDIILSIKPELPKPPVNETPEPSTDPDNPQIDPKKIEWLENNIYICNFPTIRDDVGESKNHPSHKGMIIEQLGQGGYRFRTKSGDDLITNIDLPFNEAGYYVNTVSPFLENEVEWSFDNWVYAHWYVESISGGGEQSSTTKYLKSFGINKNSLDSNKRARFDELNKRWINFNELRERQIVNTGTRIQLESMFNTEINDIKPDLIKVFNDRKEEKLNIINILKDFCLFNEFK